MAVDLNTRQAYVSWYVLPPGTRPTQKDWCAEHGVAETTPVRWQKEPWFREAVDHFYAQLNISPLRVQEVVDALHLAATRGNTHAATLYLQYIDRLAPRRVVVESREVSELTDIELAAALREAADGVG